MLQVKLRITPSLPCRPLPQASLLSQDSQGLLECVADGTFALQYMDTMIQSYYLVFAAAVLVILYCRRQIRIYQERQVRLDLNSHKSELTRITGSQIICGATWMLASASNSKSETMGRGPTGADLSGR